MNVQKVLAILLISVGAIGLAYGGFSYTKETHRVDIGFLHLAFMEKEHVYIPVWTGIAFVLAGGVLLMVRRKY